MNNNTLKNAVWVAGGFAMLVLALAGWRYTSFYGSSIEPASYRSFSVSGEGRAVVVPDIAELYFSVTTEGGTDVGALQTKNTEKMNGVIAFVKSKGVDEKDIKTQSYSIEPRYQYYNCRTNLVYPSPVDAQPCPPSEIVGYTIRQSVLVKVRKFEVIGDILAGAVEKGANSISGPSFTVDDRTAAEQKAREEAITKAREKAEQVAKAGSFDVGRLLGIDEGFQYPYYAKDVRAEAFGMGAAPTAAPAPAIEPGSEEITVTVTLRYEIR